MNKLDVRLVPVKKVYSQGGPVACRLIIFNGISQDFQYLDVPLRTWLFFGTGNEKGSQPTSRETPPQSNFLMREYLTLKAGSSLDVPIYLNRHFLFDKPGDYTIPYWFVLLLNTPDANPVPVSHTQVNQDPQWSGTVKINVVHVSAAVFAQELAAESRKVVSPDKEKWTEGAEALSFLDTPLVVPYLKAILTMPKAGEVPEVELDAIQSLLRIGTREAVTVIEDTLPDLDGSVVDESLRELTDKRIILSDKTIKSLLFSFDWEKRYATVGYLVKLGDAHDIPLLEPLQKDLNLSVMKAANDAIVGLQDKKVAP